MSGSRSAKNLRVDHRWPRRAPACARSRPSTELLMQTQERERNGRNARVNGADAAELDLRILLRALQAVRDGDFSVRLAGHQTGLAGKVADTFNEIVAANQRIPPATARP